MTTDPIRARIAAVVEKHQRRIDFNHPSYGKCYCGFNPEQDDNKHPWEAQAAHLANAVAEALALQQEQEAEAVTAIRTLHQLNTSAFSGKDRCLADGFAYPCPTLAILEGHGLLGAEQP